MFVLTKAIKPTQLKAIKMKTIINLNKNNEQVTVSNLEIAERSTSEQFTDYINVTIAYAEFCKSQTKRGQARKNERGRTRRSMFAKFSDVQEEMTEIYCSIRDQIKNEKDSEIEKVSIKIEYDGRKKNNLSRIIQGVTMAYFIGGISPQYYSIGLIGFTQLK